MTGANLTIALTAFLLLVFGAGWIAHWAWRRISGITSPREDRADEMVAELYSLEERIARVEAERNEMEAALRGEAAENAELLQKLLLEREAELDAAMTGLRAAREEIEELRAKAS